MFTYKVEVFFEGEWRTVSSAERVEDGARISSYHQAVAVWGSILTNGVFYGERPDRSRVAVRLTALRAQ